MNKKTKTTDRIEAMRQRVKDNEISKALEEERKDKRRQLEVKVSADLEKKLMALADLPVSPNGVTKVWRERSDNGITHVYVSRRGWDADGETERETLMEFVVEIDYHGEVASILHDDDRISDDVALDLATAAVEARFCLE